MNYENIISFVREQKDIIIRDMKVKLADDFMRNINSVNFNDVEELYKLRVEESALSRVRELLEEVLERLEKGV
jgi:hypothetical protein